jgi:hypothetical protein
MNIFFLSLRTRVKIVLHLDQQLCQDSLKNLCQASEAPRPSLAMFSAILPYFTMRRGAVRIPR